MVETAEQTETTEQTTEQSSEFQAADWYGGYGLDDDQSKMVSQFKDEASMAKGYCDIKKSYGTGFRMPENLTDAQQEELSIRMAKVKGVPDTKEGYMLVDAPDEVIAPGVRLSEEGKGRFLDFCLERKHSPKDANDLYQLYKEEMRTAHAANQETITNGRDETFKRISTLHGGDEAATEGMQYIKQYLKQFADGPDDFAQLERVLGLTGGGDHHILVRALWGPAHDAMSEATSPQAKEVAVQKSKAADHMKYLKEEYPESWKYYAGRCEHTAEYKRNGLL